MALLELPRTTTEYVESTCLTAFGRKRDVVLKFIEMHVDSPNNFKKIVELIEYKTELHTYFGNVICKSDM